MASRMKNPLSPARRRAEPNSRSRSVSSPNRSWWRIAVRANHVSEPSSGRLDDQERGLVLHGGGHLPVGTVIADLLEPALEGVDE